MSRVRDLLYQCVIYRSYRASLTLQTSVYRWEQQQVWVNVILSDPLSTLCMYGSLVRLTTCVYLHTCVYASSSWNWFDHLWKWDIYRRNYLSASLCYSLWTFHSEAFHHRSALYICSKCRNTYCHYCCTICLSRCCHSVKAVFVSILLLLFLLWMFLVGICGTVPRISHLLYYVVSLNSWMHFFWLTLISLSLSVSPSSSFSLSLSLFLSLSSFPPLSAH